MYQAVSCEEMRIAIAATDVFRFRYWPHARMALGLTYSIPRYAHGLKLKRKYAHQVRMHQAVSCEEMRTAISATDALPKPALRALFSQAQTPSS